MTKKIKKKVDVQNASIVKRTDYANTLTTIIAGGFCPFCEEHLAQHHQQPIVYKTPHWLVTKNNWPYTGTRFHYLFIARTHVERTEDLSHAAWADLQKVYRKLIRTHNLSGATLMIRSGDTKVTGASVNHLHAHLVVGTQRTKGTKRINALVGFKK